MLNILQYISITIWTNHVTQTVRPTQWSDQFERREREEIDGGRYYVLVFLSFIRSCSSPSVVLWFFLLYLVARKVSWNITTHIFSRLSQGNSADYKKCPFTWTEFCLITNFIGNWSIHVIAVLSTSTFSSTVALKRSAVLLHPISIWDM